VPPDLALILADSILLLHLLVVAFVVGGEILILLGGWRGWRWVRHRALRISHLALIGFVALQTWLGQLCPLTIWEQALRRSAGAATYESGFIEYWVGRLLYVAAPWWVFLAAYTGFALLVLLTWRWVPPLRRSAPGASV
jgi:hypothetical protein